MKGNIYNCACIVVTDIVRILCVSLIIWSDKIHVFDIKIYIIQSMVKCSDRHCGGDQVGMW